MRLLFEAGDVGVHNYPCMSCSMLVFGKQMNIHSKHQEARMISCYRSPYGPLGVHHIYCAIKIHISSTSTSHAGIWAKKGPAATYSPTENRSTIGVRALNCRVRDGNGCVCPAVATGPANTGEREIFSCALSWQSECRDWNSDMVKPLG